jgi:hypothetical protein
MVNETQFELTRNCYDLSTFEDEPCETVKMDV